MHLHTKCRAKTPPGASRTTHAWPIQYIGKNPVGSGNFSYHALQHGLNFCVRGHGFHEKVMIMPLRPSAEEKGGRRHLSRPYNKHSRATVIFRLCACKIENNRVR